MHSGTAQIESLMKIGHKRGALLISTKYNENALINCNPEPYSYSITRYRKTNTSNYKLSTLPFFVACDMSSRISMSILWGTFDGQTMTHGNSKKPNYDKGRYLCAASCRSLQIDIGKSKSDNFKETRKDHQP